MPPAGQSTEHPRPARLDLRAEPIPLPARIIPDPDGRRRDEPGRDPIGILYDPPARPPRPPLRRAARRHHPGVRRGRLLRELCRGRGQSVGLRRAARPLSRLRRLRGAARAVRAEPGSRHRPGRGDLRARQPRLARLARLAAATAGAADPRLRLPADARGRIAAASITARPDAASRLSSNRRIRWARLRCALAPARPLPDNRRQRTRLRPRNRTGWGDTLSDTGYRFLIADDHPLFRGALRQALEGMFAGVAILEAGTIDELSDLLGREDDVDLVLLDLAMPGVRGFSGLLYLRAQFPAVPVMIVSANEDRVAIRRAMEIGASGFIPKSRGSEVIREAIAKVLEGGTWTPPDIDVTLRDENSKLAERLATLTPQQVRVLMMLSGGLLNKQIAYELNVSEATVKAHVSAILQKLDVDSRTQAVIAAAKIESGQWQALGEVE
ncbi:response regulator transcription factor [Methylobrevis sp. L22]|uniref:Response regulator transcription factor n=1 Tax=Methylobrevis albus TaxID=2793297 RepID=A0A931HZ60_9HYPH|nr:response regulator transcription factor [Methylobrevis albus]